MSTIKLPELPAPFEPEWPDLNPHALGCGVEDRGIVNRYEAAEYGFQDGVDKAAQCVPEDIYTGEQMRAYAEEAVRQALAAQVEVVDERALTTEQRKDFIRRTSYISGADRDTRAAFVDEIARAALTSAPVHTPAPVDTSSGHSAALQVATVAMQLIRRSALSAFDRQQHDKLVQDFAALHERNPPEPRDG